MGGIDVQTFKFKRIRKLRIFRTSPDAASPSGAINLLAISNVYDLIFVGYPQGFKVFKTEDILSLEGDKNINKTTAETYKSRDIILPSHPVHLALSCDDLTLAVCVLKDNDYHSYIFDVRAFANESTVVEPFTSVRLTINSSAFLTDLIWNPAVNNALAVCLSDGTVSVYEINEKSFNIVGSVKSEATAICWSPKGKQLIVGRNDGSMIQYKPNLQVVKTIPAPNIFENPCSVANVLWLSSFSFATAYHFPNSNEEGINLVIVDTPKNSNPVFSQYEDICYGSSTDHIQRYLMIQQTEWRILICASSNSMEVGVLGFSAENVWGQWFLDDSGRAELPLDGRDEMYPIGMAISYNSTSDIPIDDNLTLPPMPILFLLSTKGILCPFHVLNFAADVPNLQKRPAMLTTDGQRFGSGNIMGSKTQVIEMAQSQGSSPLTNILSTSAKTMPTFGLPISQIETIPRRSITSGTAVTLPQKGVAPNVTASQIFSISSILNQQKLPVDNTTNTSINKPAMVSPFGLPTVPNVTVNPSISPAAMTFSPRSVVVSDASALKSPGITQSNLVSAFQPPSLIHKRTNQISGAKEAETKNTILDSSSLSTKSSEEEKNITLSKSVYTSCILEEISNFSKELLELKTKTSKFKICSDQNVLVKLKEDIGSMEKFTKDIRATSLSLNQDIHSLKLQLLETFSTLEEAISIQNRNDDPRYRQLLRSRTLDPHKIRKMKQIRTLYHYIKSQINEVNNKLDEIRFYGKKKPASEFYLPTSETIYQSVCNMQNIIENTAFKLSQLQELMTEVQKKGFTPYSKALANLSYKTKTGDTITKLSDCFHQTCYVTQSPSNLKEKKINPEREALLREMLEHRLVTPVRSSAPGSVSRLTIPESVLNASRVKDKIDSTVPENANITFAHPNLTSTPNPNAFRPLKATLHSSASIPTSSASLPVQTRSPLSLPAGEKSIQNEVNLDLNAHDSTKIVTSTSKFPAANFSLPSTANGALFTFGTMAVNKSEGSSGFTFGNKFSVSTAAFAFGTTKVTPSTSNSSLSLFTFGKKAVPEFQFKPVEAKAKNFQLGEAINNENLSQTFGQVLKDKTTENTEKSERVIATSVKAKLKTNEEEASFTVETVLEDVTPPSTPTEDEDENEEDDGEEDDEEQEEEDDDDDDDGDDDDDDDGERGDEEYEGVVIEEIFDQEEEPDDEKSSAETVEEVINLKIEDDTSQSASQATAKSGDFNIKDSLKAFSFVPTSSINNEQAQTTEKASLIYSSPSSAGITITPIDTKVPSEEDAAVFSIGENASVTITPIATSQALPATTQGSAASTFSFRQTSQAPTTAAAPFKLGLFQGQTAFKFKQGSQPSVFGGTTTTSTSSSPAITSFGQLAAPTSSLSVTTVSSALDSTPKSGAATTTTQAFGTPVTISSLTLATPSFESTPVTGTLTFGEGNTSTTAATLSFGSPTTAAPAFGTFGASTVPSQVFGTQTTTTSAATSAFGTFGVQTTSSQVFGTQTTTEATSPSFGAPTSATTPSFGTATSATTTFGSAPTFGAATSVAPVFGTATSGAQPFGTTTAASTVFGQKSGFGQSFGAAPAFGGQSPQPIFGQSGSFGNQQTSSSTFGQSGNSPFGQTQSAHSSFGNLGSPSSGFGQGGFFSGLGAKPSAENANKNVFGERSSFGAPGSTSLFGNQSQSTFGSGGGSFSSPGGSFSGGSTSVANAGFGGFQTQQQNQQQQQSPTKLGAFGSPPAFGQPAFGGAPTFGGTPGSPPAFGTTPAFSAFGNTNSPGFGTLATQQTTSFGSLAQQGGNAFGNQSFGAGPFGQQQQQQQQQQQTSPFGGNTSFGSPGSGGSPASSFSQWR